MTPGRFARIDKLFSEALDTPTGARSEWLARECGGDAELLASVQDLLALDGEAHSELGKSIRGGLAEFQAASPQTPGRAGPYRLMRELGRGGMGSVWLGVRDDGEYEGEVAVKLMKTGPGMDGFFERFRRERQALARLRHPHIARILDSGTADDGSPYILMERVEGQPIDVYCSERNLPARAIAALFIDVCLAVAHAHRQLIVHRDLKPGNILVEANGTPKLLDFGICKVLEDEAGSGVTLDGAQLMTPDYACPEQVKGDPITVASDVYSLGAVLYALLTGALPHLIEKYTMGSIAQAICETEVRPASQAAVSPARARELAGDLDRILAKALQKNPDRRYPSADALAADLRRMLTNQPIEARPDSLFYRTRKFVRRHRAGVAAALAVTAALAAGAAAYARQAAAAREQSMEARRLANSMMFEIYDGIRDLQGALPARESVVRIGLDYLDRMSAKASGDADLRRELAHAYLRMGEVMAGKKGDTSGALSAYKKGLAALAPLGGDAETALLRVLLWRTIGYVLTDRDEPAAAQAFQDGARIGERLLSENPADERIWHDLASLYSGYVTLLRPAKPAEALAMAERAKALYKAYLDRHSDSFEPRADLATMYSVTGAIHSSLGQIGQARADLNHAVQEWDTLHRESPANRTAQRLRMLAYSHLGNIQDDPSATFGTVVEIAKSLYQANPGDQNAAIDCGMALSKRAQVAASPAEARLELLREALKYLGEAARRDPNNGSVRGNMALFHYRRGDLARGLQRTAEARSEYLAGMALLEGRPPRVAAEFRAAALLSCRLAQDAAGNGDRAGALGWAKRLAEAAKSAPKADRDIAMGDLKKLAEHPVFREADRNQIRALI